MRKHYQVAIVGGGPVGAALAVNLGLRGVSCALIERRRDLHRIPKGQNLTSRTLEHFHFWGIADALRAARLMPAGYPIGELTAYKSLASEYWVAPPGREIVRPYYFQANERLPQYQMEKVLRAKLAALPSVSCHFGWSATDVRQDDARVVLELSDESGAGRAEITADYAVGCDGGHSLVRERIGIARGGTDFDQLMVLAVFRSRELHARLARFPERSTYRVMHPDLNGYWQFFGRIDVGEGFFFHAPVPADTTRDNFDFHGLIERAAGFPIDCAFEHVGFWDLRVSVADTYRRGRVFIAGDAAHTHPPYGGFGVNNGLEDVVNLGWKLEAALNGWGGPALLNSYSDERQPVFKDIGENFIAARIVQDADFFARHDPARDAEDFRGAWAELGKAQGARLMRYEPHYEGSSIVFGPPGGRTSAHGSHIFNARAGHHLAPRPLSCGANVFERLGPGFTLLAFGTEDVRAFTDAAKGLGIPLAVVHDAFDGGREDYAARLILVRPDQFVAWVGDSPTADPRSVLGRAAGHS